MQNHYPLVNGILTTPTSNTYEFFNVELGTDRYELFSNIADYLNLPYDNNDVHPLACCYTFPSVRISDNVKISITDIDLPGISRKVDTSDLSELFELSQVFYDYGVAGVEHFLDFDYYDADSVCYDFAGSYGSDQDFLDDLLENGFLGLTDIDDEEKRDKIIYYLDRHRIIKDLMQHDYVAYDQPGSKSKSYFYQNSRSLVLGFLTFQSVSEESNQV